MYEENSTSLYPLVLIVINPTPISSNVTESQGIDPNGFHSSGNAPLNSIVSTHGYTPSTSDTILNFSINGKAPYNSNYENFSNSNGIAPLSPS